MLFSAPFPLLNYLYSSCHLDLADSPVDYEAFLFCSMKDEGFLITQGTQTLLCNWPHDSVFLRQVVQCLPCCSSHHTRNGTHSQRTFWSEKSKGNSLNTRFLYPHGRGWGFSVTFVDPDDIRGNQKRPHFLHAALGQRAASESIK